MLYLVHGFDRKDHKKNYNIVVDAGIGIDVFDRAGTIIGEKDICFHMSANLSGTEAEVINAERELLFEKLLDSNILEQKFEAARKQARKERLAARRTAKRAAQYPAG